MLAVARRPPWISRERCSRRPLLPWIISAQLTLSNNTMAEAGAAELANVLAINRTLSEVC